jgi:hypothetical protein
VAVSIARFLLHDARQVLSTQGSEDGAYYSRERLLAQSVRKFGCVMSGWPLRATASYWGEGAIAEKQRRGYLDWRGPCSRCSGFRPREPLLPDSALPTLFGRFTALQSDHRALFASFRALHDMCKTTTPARDIHTRARPARLFDELLRSVSRHFSAEEGESYFGAIVIERPSLLHQVAALKAEHAAILTAMAALSHIAADGTAPAKFAAAVQHCARWFQSHEQRESLILRGFLYSKDG